MTDTYHNCPRCGHEWTGACATDDPGDQLSLLEPVPVPLANADGDGESEETSPPGSPSDAGREASSRPPSLALQTTLDVDHYKPPYRIPLMSEILSSETNGLRMISTFSGCGGSCLGFRMAGYTVLSASEFIPAAIETYAANFPETPIVVGDVRNYEPELMMARLGLERGELDVLEGSPPCASFSTAGGREKGWGNVKAYSDTRQRTDDLFDEYVRLVAGFMPRAFVAENVLGFLFGAADHFRKWIEGEMRDLGYSVAAQVVDASHHGVPQKRRRVILIGIRRDVGANPLDLYPSRLPYTYSIREAIPWMNGTSVVADRRTSTVKPEDYFHQTLDMPSPTVTASGVSADDYTDWEIYGGVAPPTQEELLEASIKGYAIESAWEKLKPDGQSSEKYFNLIRPDPDQPVPTITQTAGNQGAAGVTHPHEPRKFTIPELRRLCGFPDDFILTGTFPRQWERLGRAVPPPMMARIAERVAEALT